jgi:hypothetical protein
MLRLVNLMQMNSQTNASENNTASNHISANATNGSKTGENSDEESDAEVSIWSGLDLVGLVLNRLLGKIKLMWINSKQ